MKPTKAMKVIVGVHGGVAYPISVPAGVELEIRDYDNPRSGATQYSRDSFGDAYTSETAIGPVSEEQK